MFGDGYTTGEFERIRAALIFHFRIESGKKRFGEFGEIYVGALEGAPPENKISDQRENDQNQRQYRRVPEREPDAYGIKHGSFGREKLACRDASENYSRLRRPRLPVRSEGQRSSRHRGEYAARACWNPRQFSGARD